MEKEIPTIEEYVNSFLILYFFQFICSLIRYKLQISFMSGERKSKATKLIIYVMVWIFYLFASFNLTRRPISSKVKIKY